MVNLVQAYIQTHTIPQYINKKIIKRVVRLATPFLQLHIHHSDPLILKHTSKAKIAENYIHEGAVVLSSYTV